MFFFDLADLSVLVQFCGEKDSRIASCTKENGLMTSSPHVAWHHHRMTSSYSTWLRVPIERSARLDWTWSGLIERRRACIASARSAFTFTTISNAFWKHRGKNSFTFTTISSAFWIEIVVNVKLFFPRCFQNASYFREKISSYFREKHESRSYYQPEKTASYYQPEKTAGIWLGKSVIRLLLTAFSRCIWLVALNEKSQLHSKLFSKC